MRTIITTTALSLLIATGAALAESERKQTSDFGVTAGAIQEQFDALGYDVQRVKREHGAYEARIRDRESGGIVKVVLDPATSQIVRAKPGH